MHIHQDVPNYLNWRIEKKGEKETKNDKKKNQINQNITKKIFTRNFVFFTFLIVLK